MYPISLYSIPYNFAYLSVIMHIGELKMTVLYFVQIVVVVLCWKLLPCYWSDKVHLLLPRTLFIEDGENVCIFKSTFIGAYFSNVVI